MKRNLTTLFLISPGATTPIPWVNNAPDFSSFTNPTLSILQQSWQGFLDSGEELEIIPDPEPIVEPTTPDWDSFNEFMLTDPVFKSYRDIVRPIDGDLTSALFDSYELVDKNGVSAFSLVWGYWCQVSGITAEDKEAIASTTQELNLPADFVSTIRG